jgi:rare lipoprotein A
MRCRSDVGSSGLSAGIGAAIVVGIAVAGCASSEKFASKVDPKYGVASSPRVVEPGEPIPKGGGTYRVGKPYVVAGRTYVPEADVDYNAEGQASWYGAEFHGRLTANGEVFDMNAISAAHPTLPMPSYVRVTNLANRRSVVVRVNDRGPYRGNRVIDLSIKTARLLGFHNHGVARVRVEYIGSAPLEGSDERMLLATLRHGSPAPAPSTVMVASAKPFVPELAERQRMARSPMPLPLDRPFALGSASAALPSAVNEHTAVRRQELPRTAAGQAFATASTASPAAARMPAAVSAYAPLGNTGAASVMTGRGLY